MESDVTPDDAADLLHDRLHEEPWFNMVGAGIHEGRPAIYLYVKRMRGIKLPFTNGEWEGFPVLVMKLGTLYPA